MNYLLIEGTNQTRDSMVQEARFPADYMLIFEILVFDGKETVNFLVQRQDVRLRMGLICREVLRDGSHNALEAIQERSLGNHSWLPALDPSGSTMCAAVGPLQITAAGATNPLWHSRSFK